MGSGSWSTTICEFQGQSMLVYLNLGEIGEWKTMFTVAQNEEFERVWNEWNKDRQIPFVFE